MKPIYSLMSSAKQSLDMTMYELEDAQAITILESDAARGVKVRVLLDRAYSGASANATAYSQLNAHGVLARWAPSATIFHQKTITVDDHTTAIMTLNLTSQYYSADRDFAVITTDPRDVAAIEQGFKLDWSNTGSPQPVSAGTNLVWSPGAEPAILGLINSAQHSLLVENEEMDDPDVTGALVAAARRGVNVEVAMTDSSSWASAFAELAAAGVKVRTYSPSASLYIHAKVIVVDDTRAFVGSQNFSVSSLVYNRELGIVLVQASLVQTLATTVTSDFNGGTPYTTPKAGGCSASAQPANDGYSGDYDVFVHSDEPGEQATASDAGDSYSGYTDGDGYAVIRLWDTSPGETITVTVGGATCSTSA
jgi:cardiolipin synthase